uniref:Uncharacterized protein n=1 Tax=Ditylenchus dipsaci TaxID=166011 RepID=A0A915E363_9BILA
MASMLSPTAAFAIAYLDDIIVNIIDKNGRCPDPAKIAAVAKMPSPTDVSSLRSYLRMVKFYQAYVADMVNICKPLDLLLLKENVILGAIQVAEEDVEAQLAENVRHLPLSFKDLVKTTNGDAALLQVQLQKIETSLTRMFLSFALLLPQITFVLLAVVVVDCLKCYQGLERANKSSPAIWIVQLRLDRAFFKKTILEGDAQWDGKCKNTTQFPIQQWCCCYEDGCNYDTKFLNGSSEWLASTEVYLYMNDTFLGKASANENGIFWLDNLGSWKSLTKVSELVLHVNNQKCNEAGQPEQKKFLMTTQIQS